MRLAVRKLDVADVGQLVQLVAENIESLEPGLSVIDARLLLGHATIDIAAVDGEGALVLIALGTTADETLLMGIVEAYSWCLEYPHAVQRLYPSLRVSPERPPRVIFVVERMPDSFQRKMRQLNFADVICVEFRPLEVNGFAAILFDRVAGNRQGMAPRPTERAPMPAPTLPMIETVITAPSLLSTNGHGLHANGHFAAAVPTQDAVRDEMPNHGVTAVSPEPPLTPQAVGETAEAPIEVGGALDEIVVASRAEIAMAEQAPALADESPALELQSTMVPLDASALDAVLEEIGRDAAARVGDAPMPVAEAEPELALESAAPTPEPVLEVASALEVELGSTMESALEIEAAPEIAPTLEVEAAPQVEEVVVAEAAAEGAVTIAETPGRGLRALLDEIGRAPVTTPPAATPRPTPAAPAERGPASGHGLRGLLDEIAKAPSAPAVAAAKQPIPAAPAKPSAESTGLRGLVSEIEATLARGTTASPMAPTTPPAPPVWAKVAPAPTPATAPAPMAAPVVPAEAAKDLVAELPADFDNLKFPKDGVLTRQWMEFLNQMASSK
jgi:hypothetical protein